MSEAVLEEAAAGNPEAAAKRLAALAGISVLRGDAVTDALALHLVTVGALPQTAAMDAMHVAAAAVNSIQVLLTWNCSHLANPATRVRIERACRRTGWNSPVVCTPMELGGS